MSEHNLELLSGILADKIGVHIDGYMHHAQRGIGGGSRGSKHQLLINRSVAKDARSRRTNLAMAWIDYKKGYDSVPPLIDTGMPEAIQD